MSYHNKPEKQQQKSKKAYNSLYFPWESTELEGSRAGLWFLAVYYLGDWQPCHYLCVLWFSYVTQTCYIPFITT